MIFIRHSQRPGMFVISPLLLIGEATHHLPVVLTLFEADLIKAGKPTSTNKLRKFVKKAAISVSLGAHLTNWLKESTRDKHTERSHKD